MEEWLLQVFLISRWHNWCLPGLGFAVMPVREISITLFAVLWTKYGITESEIIKAEPEWYYYTYIVALRSPFSHIELVHWKQCSYMAHDNIAYNVLSMYSSYCPRFIYKIWIWLIIDGYSQNDTLRVLVRPIFGNR